MSEQNERSRRSQRHQRTIAPADAATAATSREARGGGVAGGLVLLMAAIAVAAFLRGSPAETAEAVAVAPLEGHRIDLNRADERELALLPEIGPTTARAIVDDRQARGPFPSVNDLARVRGIGPATVAAVAPYATVASEARDEGQGPRPTGGE